MTQWSNKMDELKMKKNIKQNLIKRFIEKHSTSMGQRKSTAFKNDHISY